MLLKLRIRHDLPVISVFKEQSSAIVAFDVEGDETIGKFRDEFGDNKIDDLHMTLLYLGDLQDVDKDQALQMLETFAQENIPIEGEYNGYAVFSTDDEENPFAHVLTFDSPEISDFQRRLRIEFGTPKQDHGFVPHTTLGYTSSEVGHDISVKYPKIFDKISLFYGDEVYLFPLGKIVEEKQLPIDDESKANLVQIRINLFYDISDALSEQMFTGEISIGTWEEQMKLELRGLHSSAAAIAKGGWDQMTFADWGRLGPIARAQYRWLHNFAEHIAENRDVISLAYVRARAHLYGEAAGYSANVIQAGTVIEGLLPWLPRDGSTECLNGCKCRWELDIIRKENDFNIVRAVWRLGEAEHCEDCVPRNGHIETIRVHNSVQVPQIIGGF